MVGSGIRALHAVIEFGAGRPGHRAAGRDLDHGADVNVPIGARHALGRAPGSEVGNRHALLARQARHDRTEGGRDISRTCRSIRPLVCAATSLARFAIPYNAFPPLSLKAGLLSDASDRSL